MVYFSQILNPDISFSRLMGRTWKGDDTLEQVDIKRLYTILAEFQKLDPKTAERLFQRILKALHELMKQTETEKKESISADEML